jgi:hypothetical protein
MTPEKQDQESLPEQCLTVGDIAERWKLSKDSIRRIFAQEDGVIKIGQPTRLVGRKYQRHYSTLRIPLSVFLRVQDRLMYKRSPEVVRSRTGSSRRNLDTAG